MAGGRSTHREAGGTPLEAAAGRGENEKKLFNSSESCMEHSWDSGRHAGWELGVRVPEELRKDAHVECWPEGRSSAEEPAGQLPLRCCVHMVLCLTV